MKELKRILENHPLVLAVLLLLLLNGILFYGTQKAQNFGLDLSVSANGSLLVGFDGINQESTSELDGAQGYPIYQKWLAKYKDMPLTEATKKLEQQKRQLESMDTERTRLDYVAVHHLLQQLSYLNDYGNNLNAIQENKDTLLSFSIFSDPHSFSGRNILKTANDFEKLQGVSLRMGADGAINAFMNFPLTDYLLLLVLTLFCIAFLEERKKGLWRVIHATSHGRLRLGLQRMSILFGASAVSVALFYGTNLCVGFALYGGAENLDRAVQSVEVLGKLPEIVTIAGFLARYLLLRIATAFFVALLLWFLLSTIHNVKYTILVTTGFLVIEYTFFAFLPVQSVFNFLKYFNIFTYISLSDLYTQYLNVDFLGFPLGIRSISQFAMLPLGILLMAGCLVSHCCKKPDDEKILLGHIAYRINRTVDKGLRHLHLFGMEVHKTLFAQKGVVLIGLFVYISFGLSFIETIPVYSPTDIFARQYTAELEGAIDENTFEKIDRIQAELDKTIVSFQEAEAAYQKGSMEYPQFDTYAREGSVAQFKKDALSMVHDRAAHLRELEREKGISPWLVDEIPYESVYGTATQRNQQNAALVAILTLTLLLAGCMTAEKQTGMMPLLIATPRGRQVLLHRKIAMSATFTTIIWAVIYGLEIHAFWGITSVHTLAASVQNLAMLENFPFSCTIGTFLILLYALRWLALFACGMFTLFISSRMERLEASCIAANGALILPSLLYYYIGIAPLKYLSLTLPVTAIGLLLPRRGAICLAAIAIAALTALSMGCWFALKREWRV